MPDLARELLKGAIDLHIHTAPDIVPRRLDDFGLAEAARAAGMAAIVLKSHHMLTADRAQLAEKAVPGVRVLGGLALNVPACGGLNPEAVKVAIRMGAKTIWLPTLSAANHIQRTRSKVTGNLGVMSSGFKPLPAPVLDEAGTVRPALQEILALIADADILLATGHLSVAEIGVVVDAALAAGVRKIVVNHPDLWLIDMDVAEQRRLAARGVMLELCVRSLTAPGHGAASARDLARQIRAVGPAHVVMATDLGQRECPPPADGLCWYIAQMLECGISPAEIAQMTKANPARLLGL